MTDAQPTYHLSHVKVENVKAIRGCQVTIEQGALVVVSGRNGAGKTSFVDAIWYALGGTPALKNTVNPVTNGQETGLAEVTIGEGADQLVVTRRWTKGGAASTLRIERAGGFRASSPQTLLDSLMNPLARNPLAFMTLSDAKQVAALVDALKLPIDLDGLDARRKELYDQRTVANRDRGTLQKRLDGMPRPPDGTPDEMVSIDDLLAEQDRIQASNALRDEATRTYRARAEERDRAQDRVTTLEAQLEAARLELADAQQAKDAALTALDQTPEPQTTDDVRARLAEVTAVNQQVLAKDNRKLALQALDEATREWNSYDKAIDGIDHEKRTALAAADMPYPGLAFAPDGTGLLLYDIPLRDCSAAEQRIVACTLAMAGDPALRLVTIEDGSLFDSESLARLERLAAAKDFQVLIEVVDETGGKGIVFEDGEVVPPTTTTTTETTP